MDSIRNIILCIGFTVVGVGFLFFSKYSVHASWIYDADPPQTALTVSCLDASGALVATLTDSGGVTGGNCPYPAVKAHIVFTSCTDSGTSPSGCNSTNFSYYNDGVTLTGGIATAWPYAVIGPNNPPNPYYPDFDLTNPLFPQTTITYSSQDKVGNSEAWRTFTITATANITGNVYVDFNNNGFAPDSGEPAFAGATVTLTGGPAGQILPPPAITDASGHYAFNNLLPADISDPYTVTLTTPIGYELSTPAPCLSNPPANPAGTPPCVTSGILLPPNQTVNFYLLPTYTVSGVIYQDDTGSLCNVTKVPLSNASVTLDETVAPTSSNSQTTGLSGAYSFPALLGYSGGTQQSYTDSVIVSVGKVVAMNVNGSGWNPSSSNAYSPITFGYVGPEPPNPNFTVDFCISTVQAWWGTDNTNSQVAPGDVRMGTITDPVPSSQYASTTTNSYRSVFFSSQNPSNFAPGGSSNICTPADPNCLTVQNEYGYNNNNNSSALGLASFDYYIFRANQLGIPIQQLVGPSPDLSTTPLSTGIYEINGNAIITNYVQSPQQHIVLLVNGDVTIKTKISVPSGQCAAGSTPPCNLFVLAAKGNIYIDPTVGETTVSTQCDTSTDAGCDLDGIYTAEGSFVVAGSGCPLVTNPDKRLNIAGTVVTGSVNPFLGTGTNTFINQRSLCPANDPYYPSVMFYPRYDFVLQLTDFYKQTNNTWQEVQP